MPKRSQTSGYLVFGTILDEDGRKLSGLSVEALDADMGGADRLGSATTDEAGRYEIRYSAKDFRKTRRESGGAELFIRVRDRAGRLLLETRPIPDAPAEQRIDAVIPQPGQSEDDGRYRIRGVVVSSDLPTLQGLTADVIEVGVFDESVVASVALSEDGVYEVSFVAARREKVELPDICLAVRDGKTEVARSPVLFDARPGEFQIDLELPAGMKPTRPEFDVVKDKLGALYGDRLLAMDDKAFVDSLGYAASKTRWDARALAMARLALSYAASKRVDGMIPAELFYALFRAGVPGTEGAPYRVVPDAAEGIWTNAMANGVIRRFNDKELFVAKKRFIALAAESSLDTPSPADGSTLDALLSGAFGEDRDSKAGVAELLNRHAGDGDAFWTALGRRFGAERRDRLKEDVALTELALGNLAVVGRLRDAVPRGPLDLDTLATRGFGQPKAWRDLIGDLDAPSAVEGKGAAARRRAYAETLAEQVRLQQPVAVIAHEVREGILPVPPGLRKPVHALLHEHRKAFRLGEVPFNKYVEEKKIRVSEPVRTEILKIERVHRFAPEARAMHALLKADIHSAYQVARYEPAEFVERFAAKMGGPEIAERVIAAARETHASLINLAVSYQTEKTMLRIGVDRTPITGVPAMQQRMMASTARGVDMEGLFGELDFCACSHCRSILSPAAYLVSLLQLCEPPSGTPASPSAGKWPIDEILARRPDILERPLTCENTHVPVPHIDIVNETLEYFIGASSASSTSPRLSLNGFKGFSTDPKSSPQEILAEPQNIARTAYDRLATARFPLTLPFSESLSSLRQYLAMAGMTLAQAMEVFRADDGMGSASASGYDWQHILLEELGVSQQEYNILTDRTIPIAELYGGATASELKNARFFARRVGISYEELSEILQTRFVNPNTWVLPMASALGVSIQVIKEFTQSPPAMSDAAFLAKLASGLDPASYGGSICDWVRDNAESLFGLLTLHNTAASPDPCDFSNMEFRYGDVTRSNAGVSDLEFVRLLRFIRIWKRLKWPASSPDGDPRAWSIAEVDAALTALYPVDQLPLGSSAATNLQRLDEGCKRLLLRLGALQRLARLLGVTDASELRELLACVAPMQGADPGSLYRELFLSAGVLRDFPDFALDKFGRPITDETRTLGSYGSAVQAAFKISPEDYALIIEDLGLASATIVPSVVTTGILAGEAGYLRRHFRLETLSKIYRRAWLARKLGLSISALLSIAGKTGFGLDADIGANDGIVPPNRLEGLIRWIESVRQTGLGLDDALTVFWNGQSAQSERTIHDAASRLAVDLRSDLAQIEAAMIVKDDPASAALVQLLTTTLGAETTDLFMSYIERRARTEVPYAHGEPRLHDDTMKIDAGLAYDDVKKLLIYTGGALSATVAASLSAGSSAVPSTPSFKDAVGALYIRSRKPLEALGLPDLVAAHDAYMASTQSEPARRRALLDDAIKVLKPIRQLQALMSRLQPVLGGSEALLSDLLTKTDLLCAHKDPSSSAHADFLGLSAVGIKGTFKRGTAERRDPQFGSIDYGPTGATVVPSFGSSSNAPITGKWTGFLAIPPGGAFNIAVLSDTSTSAPTLRIGGAVIPLVGPSGSSSSQPRTWRNSSPLAFNAGTAVPFELEVSDVRGLVRFEWAIAGGTQTPIPASALYSDDRIQALKASLIRLHRANLLHRKFGLDVEEFCTVFSLAALRLTAQGSSVDRPLLSILPTDEAAPSAMASRVWELATFLQVRRMSGASPAAMVALLRDPVAQIGDTRSLFMEESGWVAGDVDAMLARLRKTSTSTMSRSDLQKPAVLGRVHEALRARRRAGAQTTTILAAVGHAPAHAQVSALYSEMRARRSAPDWLAMVKPVNDRLRAERRDALVAFALVKLAADPTRKGIDTADRLYEYLWLDVLMHPRVETSRIRQDIASVQQFIQRLIELPGTESAAIQIPLAMRERWPWMKRYRVWEANRKVFLYPENYMIPELRDDQSPIFKETMSELLQGDITEERAAEAMIGYLRKLEEVSRLETSAIHVDTRETAGDATDDVTHVIGRTSGANRKYFYRRREPTGWTPWESVKLEIEDDPVLPIRWKGRLFLFWLKVLQEGSAALPAKSVNGTDFKPEAPKVVVKAMLCWSEYLDGKWGTTRTSSVDRAVTIGDSFTAPGGANAFLRSEYRLWARKKDEKIELFIARNDDARNMNQRGADFTLFNSFSEPDVRPVGSTQIWIFLPTEPWRTSSVSRSSTGPALLQSLQLRYVDGGKFLSTDDVHNILARKDGFSGIATVPRDDFSAEWHRRAPVIYQDSRYSFFISAKSIRLGSVRPFHAKNMTLHVEDTSRSRNADAFDARRDGAKAVHRFMEDKPFNAYASVIVFGDATTDEET